MPGTFSAIYIVAFDLDDRDQAAQAFAPRKAISEAAAIEEPQQLADIYAGVVVRRRPALVAMRIAGLSDRIEILYRHRSSCCRRSTSISL